jgi:hypothetical protein
MEKLNTYDAIYGFLQLIGVKYFTINDDNSVNINQDLDLSAKNLKELPFKIKEVAGNFFVNNNKLNNFKNFPELILGDFILSDNCYTTLKGLENINFQASLDVSYNKLTELAHLPNEIAGFFACAHNKLTTLKGSPSIINGAFFSCANNQLTSLESGPKWVEYDYYCQNNQLVSLLGISPQVKTLNCSHNKLTNLEHGPEMCSTIDISFNQINTLKYLPELKEDSLLNLEENHLTDLHDIAFPFSIDLVLSKNKITKIEDLNLENLIAHIYQYIDTLSEQIVGLEDFYQSEDKSFLRIHTNELKNYYLSYKEKKLLDSQINYENVNKKKTKL